MDRVFNFGCGLAVGGASSLPDIVEEFAESLAEADRLVGAQARHEFEHGANKRLDDPVLVQGSEAGASSVIIVMNVPPRGRAGRLQSIER